MIPPGNIPFIEFFDKLPELAKYETTDDIILNINIVKLSELVGTDINQSIFGGKSLLECVLETFQRHNNKNTTQKLLRKIIVLITRGARCHLLSDPNILVGIITKCVAINNRTNFQFIT